MHLEQYQPYHSFQPSSIKKSKSTENIPIFSSQGINLNGNFIIKGPMDRKFGNNDKTDAKLSARLYKPHNNI